MPLKVTRTGQFKRDFKRISNSNIEFKDSLKEIIQFGLPIPKEKSDHPLHGKLKNYRDVHVKPDLVLIYKKSRDELLLARLGSPSELFR